MNFARPTATTSGSVAGRPSSVAAWLMKMLWSIWRCQKPPTPAVRLQSPPIVAASIFLPVIL